MTFPASHEQQSMPPEKNGTAYLLQSCLSIVTINYVKKDGGGVQVSYNVNNAIWQDTTYILNVIIYLQHKYTILLI